MHLVQYVSVVTASNDTLTFYFRFEMPNIYYFRTYVYSIVSVQYVDQKLLKCCMYELQSIVSIQTTVNWNLWWTVGMQMGYVTCECYSKQDAFNPPPLLSLRQCYPHPEFMTTTATTQLNKLPVFTIIFRTTEPRLQTTIWQLG